MKNPELTTHKITIDLTPAAHGMLVAMAAHDNFATLEECIINALSTEVSSFCEGIGDSRYCEELFITGRVRRQRARKVQG